MRYRIATAAAARVLPTLDGPLAVEAGESVLTVIGDAEDLGRVVHSLLAADSVRRKLQRGRR